MVSHPKYKKVVFVSDIHAPFHDKKSIEALVSFIGWWKPDTLVFMGDVVDFYAISCYNKDPERALRLQDELDKANLVLEDICKAAPSAEKIYLKGNHEERLQKYLWNTARELSGLRSLSFEKLIELNELNIKYIKHGRTILQGTLIKHGDLVRKFTCYTARGEFDSSGLSGVSGHTHRLGIYSVRNDAGYFNWMECGHLSDPNQEYLQGKTANWQSGFGIGFYKIGSKRFNVNIVPIINGKAMYGGYEFYD